MNPDLITFSMFGSQNLSESDQSHQTRRLELSNWNELNQPELITFSMFGSQNLSESNQSHQTRRLELSNWNELNQQNLIIFSIFGSLNLSKRNQSHQTRRSELSNWNGLNQPNLITFSSFGSQNLSKRNQNIWNRCMYSWAVSRVRSGPGPVPVRDRVCGKPGVPCLMRFNGYPGLINLSCFLIEVGFS